MRTIGFVLPSHERSGTAACDLCGVMWHRSKLTRKRNGLSYCPDDVSETDAVTLTEANAAAAGQRRRRIMGEPVGATDRTGTDDPSTIYGSDLEAWYRSDRGTFKVGTAWALEDMALRSKNRVVTVSGAPAYTLLGGQGGTPSIAFDGVDDQMKLGSGLTLAASDMTAWLVVKAGTWANEKPVLSMRNVGGTSGAVLYMMTGPDRWLWEVTGSSAVNVASTTGANDSSYHLIRLHVDGDSADTIGIGVDGGTVATTAWTQTNPTLSSLELATGWAGGWVYTSMTLKECAVAGVVSTSAQDAKAFTYIRSRYGLTIAGSTASTNTVVHYTNAASWP